MEDFYRLEDSLQSFANEPGHGNMYNQDEFTAANDLKDAICSKDFAKMTQVLKQPIFGYIELEVVKPLKKFAQKPPDHIKNMASLSEGTGGDPTGSGQSAPMTKEQVLDAVLL